MLACSEIVQGNTVQCNLVEESGRGERFCWNYLKDRSFGEEEGRYENANIW